MSDSMERDKDERLTPKEREEKEKMKRELLDLQMYETWYLYKDMKQILGVINESKVMANMSGNGKKDQKELKQSSNDYTSDTMPKTNLAQELEIQGTNEVSQLIHSYKANHTAPMHEKISAHGCSSPDLASSVADSRTSMLYKGKNLDSDDMFVRLQDNLNTRDGSSHGAGKYISLKSRNSTQDSDVLNSTETKADVDPECEEKVDRWKINPLDSYVSENDVPLREPTRPLVEDRMPFRLCKDAQTPEMLEKLLPALNFHLKETAELWHSWHRTADTKFQWGSPIQVGHTKDNSDKGPLSNVKTAEQSQMECTKNKCSIERPTKRKLASILSPPDARYSSSDDDEDDKIFTKKKILFHEDANRILRSSKMVRSEREESSDHENVRPSVLDETETEKLQIDSNEQQSKESLTPELIPFGSNKIPPPNIRKSIVKRREQINNTSARSPVAHSSKKKPSATSLASESNTLTEEEMLVELDKDNEDIRAPSKDTEIKPLPIKGLSRRIRNECMILEKIQLEKRKKLESEKEEAQRREIEEKKKREEFYKRQLQERLTREKQREKKEKDREEQSKKWNTVVDSKAQKRIGKEDKEKLQGSSRQSESKTEIVEDGRTFEDDGVFVIDEMEAADSLANSVTCPICNKSFPSDKIEVHAAECDQYMSENDLHLFECKTPPENTNSSEILECGLCSKYRTTNGIDYEEHVNGCLQKQHEEESLTECSSNQIDNILSSPIRCYRPISEQTDSYIDYKKQFPSNSRKQIHSRKRKR